MVPVHGDVLQADHGYVQQADHGDLQQADQRNVKQDDQGYIKQADQGYIQEADHGYALQADQRNVKQDDQGDIQQADQGDVKQYDQGYIQQAEMNPKLASGSVRVPLPRFEKEPASEPREDSAMWTYLPYLLAIALYLVDYGSDIWVIVLLYRGEGWSTYTVVTILLLVLPILLVNTISGVWYNQDYRGTGEGVCPVRTRFLVQQKTRIGVGHLVLLGPVTRQVHLVWCKLHESGPNGSLFTFLRLYYERDAAYLALMDAILQDSPQLLFQSFILLTRNYEELTNPWTSVIQIGSILMSLSSISMAMVSHVTSCHEANPSLESLSLSARAVHWCWRMGILSSRMLTFSLFLSVYKIEFAVFLGLHCLLMFVWIKRSGSNFCGSRDNVKRPVEELVYDVVLAFIYVFDILNIKEGATRWRNFWFYLLSLLELVLMLSLWMYKVGETEGLPSWSYTPSFQIVCICSSAAFFIFGILFLLLYYTRFHTGRQGSPRGWFLQQS